MTHSSAYAKTVLVASSTDLVRRRFRSVLEQAGHRVVAAARAPDVLALAHDDAGQLDLVMLDLRLPGASGLDLARFITTLDQRHLSLLVFSGSIASADEVRGLAEMGISGYISEHSAVEEILPALAPHLYPERFNRRGGPRVRLATPIQYDVGRVRAAALTLDLGHGGVGVRTLSPVEEATEIRVQFRIPGRARDLDARGRVVWGDAHAGMGIQFSNVEPESQVAIDEFIDAHFLASRNT